MLIILSVILCILFYVVVIFTFFREINKYSIKYRIKENNKKFIIQQQLPLTYIWVNCERNLLDEKYSIEEYSTLERAKERLDEVLKILKSKTKYYKYP